MPAVAFSNNDIAVVAWTFDRHLDGCLGFAIHQIDIDANHKETVLPALARFANQDKDLKLTTEQAEAERDRGRSCVVADQLEFIVRGDPGIDEEVGDDGDKGRTEVDQERRQSGQ